MEVFHLVGNLSLELASLKGKMVINGKTQGSKIHLAFLWPTV